MSVFNGEDFLRESIESILNQTFKDFEFIIVDDGSTDGTKRILSEYREKDSRIEIIINEKNIGLTKSLNKALKMTKGEYIARHDADDISLSQRFEKQIEFLQNNPDVKILGTYAHIISQNKKLLKKEILPTSDLEIRKLLIKRNSFVHSSIMIKKEIFDRVGLYNEQFKTTQDYELWFRALKISKGANLPLFLVEKRYLPEMVSLRKEKTQLKNTLILQNQAIKKGVYSRFCYIYSLRPYVSLKCPLFFKKFLRKHILKSKAIFKEVY